MTLALLITFAEEQQERWNTLRTSRKIDAAKSGAVRMPSVRRSLGSQTSLARRKITSPAIA
jgi:hypothetical protein